MAISDVSLTSSARANLVSIQDTNRLLNQTQSRLATGKKVNSALDNATSFFQSQNFLNRASDFARVKDSLSNALETVKATSSALASITKVVEQLQGIANSALAASGDTTTRRANATSFNALRSQIDNLVDDATFNGTNLLDSSSNSLLVNFNESAANELTVQGVNANVAGLGVTAAAGNFATDANITAALGELSTALSTLRSNASSFGNNATLIQTRVAFTTSLINSLQSASDNLVLADTNEEGANLQALQARSQLGIVSLGISGQQAQAVLRLF